MTTWEPLTEDDRLQISGVVHQNYCMPDVFETVAAIVRAHIPATTPSCNECNRDVPEADVGPSCGAHVLHIECGPWFGCRECYLIRSEIP